MTYDYKVDILRNGIVIGNMNATSVQIHYDSTAKIKRSATITADLQMMEMQRTTNKVQNASTITFIISAKLYSDMHETKEFVFNTFTDRLRPVVMIDGIPHSQGLFIVCGYPTSVEGSYVSSSIECYDETFILDQSAISSRLFIASGTKYTDAIQNILVGSGLDRILCDDADYVLNAEREFKIGENKLEIINTLMDEMNYENIFADGDGYLHLQKKRASNTPEYIYRSGNKSIIATSITKQKDIYNIPNVFVGVVSNPDVEPMVFKKVNENVQSELSVQNRGYELAKVYEFDDVATLDELKGYVNDEYLKSMMATETISFSTAIDGSHSHRNVIQIDTDNVKGLYVETAWDLDFSGTLEHTAERKIYE